MVLAGQARWAGFREVARRTGLSLVSTVPCAGTRSRLHLMPLAIAASRCTGKRRLLGSSPRPRANWAQAVTATGSACLAAAEGALQHFCGGAAVPCPLARVAAVGEVPATLLGRWRPVQQVQPPQPRLVSTSWRGSSHLVSRRTASSEYTESEQVDPDAVRARGAKERAVTLLVDEPRVVSTPRASK